MPRGFYIKLTTLILSWRGPLTSFDGNYIKWCRVAGLLDGAQVAVSYKDISVCTLFSV